jgi:hypothetical protein
MYRHGSMKKQPLALRIDADLLNEARRCAAGENRTLTNFIETLLKAHIADGLSLTAGSPPHRASNTTASGILPPRERRVSEARRHTPR